MNKPISHFLLIVILLISLKGISNYPPAWGFFGHRKINRQAVFTLPPEMMVFFKENIEYLTAHAIDADKRRYASKYEAVRHYIDLDVHGEMPFDHLPKNWSDALIQFSPFYFVDGVGDTTELFLKNADIPLVDSLGQMRLHPRMTNDSLKQINYKDFRRFFNGQFLPDFYEDHWSAPCDSLAQVLNLPADSLSCKELFAIDHLSEHGILPWHLQRMLRRLSKAFEEKDAVRIRRFAADIGHYIGDAHVPLHTTENYNGQLTGQTGIHAFWESRLPELFADDRYDFWVGKAEFIENPSDYFWNIVFESHVLVDSVLAIELDLRKRFPSDQQMCHETRNGRLVRTQCSEYAAAYHQRMGNMVEQRMKDAIHAVGSAWYTAWIMGGQPDLSGLSDQVVVDSLAIGEVKEKKGFLKLRRHE